jgi:hypothetical protein
MKLPTVFQVGVVTVSGPSVPLQVSQFGSKAVAQLDDFKSWKTDRINEGDSVLLFHSMDQATHPIDSPARIVVTLQVLVADEELIGAVAFNANAGFLLISHELLHRRRESVVVLFEQGFEGVQLVLRGRLRGLFEDVV